MGNGYRLLSQKEMERRDKKVVELYQQGISPSNIRLRFGKGIDVFVILRKHGIEPSQKSRGIAVMGNKTQDMLKKLAEMPEEELDKALKEAERKRESKDKER